MKPTSNPIPKIKSEEKHNNTAKVSNPSGTKVPAKKKDAVAKPEPKVKTQVKPESADNKKVRQNAADIANPLFGRAGSTYIEEEEREDPPKNQRARSDKSKAVLTHKGKVVSALAEVTKQMKTTLEKDEGVVVNATMLAEDSTAVLDQGTFEWSHLMRLRSDTPFRLAKSTILRSGPYANHVAIILRQETRFRLLALPLHIRIKIFNLTLKHHEPSIPIVIKQNGARTASSPTYRARFLLSILQSCKQIHAEAAPLVYGQVFQFPGTQVICDFLLRIGSNRRFLRSLRSESYTSKSARTMFHLLAEARHLERLSFAHVSSSEMPKTAVKNIWQDAATWLSGLDKNNPCKGLDVLVFDEQAFHMREKERKTGVFRVLQWGPAEQLEFLKGLRAKMVGEGKQLKKAE